MLQNKIRRKIERLTLLRNKIYEVNLTYNLSTNDTEKCLSMYRKINKKLVILHKQLKGK